MTIKKKGIAKWNGTIKEGKGEISLESGAFENQPYGFNTRFEDKKGTNPEELLGASHAACFSMAFSKIIGDEELVPERIETEATISLEKDSNGFKVTKSFLKLSANIPNITEEKFNELATKAKDNCPISKALNIEIELDASLSI